MKQPSTLSATDKNWNWPDKTWFRERLSAIKAQEQQARRRPIVSPHKPSTMTSPKTDPSDILEAK